MNWDYTCETQQWKMDEFPLIFNVLYNTLYNTLKTGFGSRLVNIIVNDFIYRVSDLCRFRYMPYA